MGKGSPRRGRRVGGAGRGRGPPRASDAQRDTSALVDAASSDSSLELEDTDVGTGGTPEMQFLNACSYGDLDRVKAVVDSMDEAKRESLASMRFYYGPLHSAASVGDIVICRYLLEQLGFDVNSDVGGHETGATPLQYAVTHEKIISVRYFLEKGADPNRKDSNGTTPLHEAAELGYDDIMLLLLEKGANVDEPSYQGTPLAVAAAHGKFTSMRILLAHHADPNKVSGEYGTPLTTALYASPDRVDEDDCLECVKLLVKAGADVECKNPETPLAIATNNELPDCAQYLLEASENARKDRLKSNGAKAVQEKNFAAASKFYSEAIELDPEDAVLYSNRSLCHLKCDDALEALVDANACIRLKPEWHKGYYRKGAALMSLVEYKGASDAFLAGVKLMPENKEMEEAYREAVEAMKKEDSEASLDNVD